MKDESGRRWLRFSVRTLLNAMAIGSVWRGWRVKKVQRGGRRAIQKVERTACFKMSRIDKYYKRTYL